MSEYKRLTEREDYTEQEKRKHLTVVLCGMRKRCYKPNSNCYKNYGGRGITVCDEWLGKDGQKNFYKWAIENGYKKGMTIDRIDNNGNYTPENCRWATPKTQAYNRSTNSYITIHGKTQTVSEWADEIGITRGAMQNRLRYGWSEDRLLEPAYEPLKMSKGQMSAEIRRLRKLEKEINQKIESGLLVELPCMVGDTVYMPWTYDGVSAVAEIIVIDIDMNAKVVVTNLESDDNSYLMEYNYGVFGYKKFGKTVFLTKAEAEARLKEIRDETNN